MKVLNLIPALAFLFFASFSFSSCAKEEVAEIASPTTSIESGNAELQFSSTFSLPAEAAEWTEEEIASYIQQVEKGEIIVERSDLGDVEVCMACVFGLPTRFILCVGGSSAYLLLTPNSITDAQAMGCDACELHMAWSVVALTNYEGECDI